MNRNKGGILYIAYINLCVRFFFLNSNDILNNDNDKWEQTFEKKTKKKKCSLEPCTLFLITRNLTNKR